MSDAAVRRVWPLPSVNEDPPTDTAPLRDHAASFFRHALRPGTYIGAVKEVALAAVHVATYPLGMRPGPSPAVQVANVTADAAADDAPELTTDTATARMPVLLLHGYIHNRSAFLVMTRTLKRAGFAHVHAFNYNPLVSDVHSIAIDLAAEVERLLAATGAPRCMLVGHSMGGIIARTYVQDLGGYDTVDTVITLGAPHRGTFTAYLGPGPATRQIRPGSQFLRHLEETARPSDVRWISYFANLDVFVTPAVNAKLVHPALGATNIPVADTGHLSLLLSGEVLRDITAHLIDRDLHREGALPDAPVRPRRGPLRLLSDAPLTSV